MFALEIINALNDPDNPAKPKGLNAQFHAMWGYRHCKCEPETNEQASAALACREERAISHYSGGRFRY